MTMTFYVLSRRIFLAFYFYIFTVTGTTNIKTQCDGKVSGELNITCVVDPQLSFVSITLPDGTNAASCTAPLPGIPTNCPQLGPYVTFPTTVGTVTTFILKIPSLDISTHEGNWTCHHSVDSSAGKVCVNAPLFSQGKEPTFTATYTSNSITFSGEAYCQHPVSAVKIELLHAEENGAFTTLTPRPSISIQNLGSNGCGSQESNVSFSGILSCDIYTLAGKTFTLMARFTQSNLPTDSNTYNVTSSGSFSCPDVETTTTMNSPEKGLSTGEVIGIVIGVLVSIIVVVVVVVYVCKHKKKARTQQRKNKDSLGTLTQNVDESKNLQNKPT